MSSGGRLIISKLERVFSFSVISKNGNKRGVALKRVMDDDGSGELVS